MFASLSAETYNIYNTNCSIQLCFSGSVEPGKEPNGFPHVFPNSRRGGSGFLEPNNTLFLNVALQACLEDGTLAVTKYTLENFASN